MILIYEGENQNHIIQTNLQISNEDFFFHFLQNDSLQVPCIKRTSLISTKVRNALNDSFWSRTELVQNAYDTSST